MIAAARPSLTSVSAKVASSAATTTSEAATMPMPPARTAPPSRVTTGLSIATMSRCSATIARVPSSMPPDDASERSAPEQKTRPDEVISTTLTAGSAAAPSSAATSSETSWRDSALRLCGESRVMVATASATEWCTSSGMSSSCRNRSAEKSRTLPIRSGYGTETLTIDHTWARISDMEQLRPVSAGDPSDDASPDPGAAPDLTDLLRRAARADESAFAALYDVTSRRVYGMVLRVVRDPAQAEEVTQEVFLEIWRTSGRFDATYHHRTQPVDHDTTVEAVDASLDARRVRGALQTLTEVQREAVGLAYFGGYTHTEVATMLDLPVGTAKTRIRDGLIRLRDALGVAS